MKLLSLLLKPTRIKEIIRCTLPNNLTSAERARLILDLTNIAYKINTAQLTKIEITYGPGNDKALWIFELDHTANLSLTDNGILWMPDKERKILIPFHTDLIGEVYITTLGDTA